MEKKKILVVDSMPMNRSLIKAFLQAYGFTVDIATDGIEGLYKVQNNRYECIISDINMPIMNGFEFLMWVKTQSPIREVPVVILAYPTEKKDISRARQLGASEFIFKPFTKGKMDEALRMVGVLEEIQETKISVEKIPA